MADISQDNTTRGPKPVDNLPTPTWPVKAPAPVLAPVQVIDGIKNRKLVLDTAPFIARIQFGQYGSEYYTIPEVLKEVRDGKARAFLESLPFTIKVREPSAQAYSAVVEFSKKTGDFPTLSKVDLKVLALAYMLEVEAHGGSSHLRSAPVSAELLTQPASTEIYLPKTTSAGSTDKPAAEESKDDNDDDSSSEDEHDGKELVGFGEFDSDEDEGWISNDNIKEYTKSLMGREEGALPTDDAVKVSTLTSDFAMQNVLIQMGMHLTSVNGVTIKRLSQWILRCFACFKICRDMTKLFCPSCGNNTLQRVQCTVDADGRVVLTNVKTKISTRGTIYSIPKPKGGCKNKNLILSSSSIPNWMSQKHSKAAYDVDSSFGTKSRPGDDQIVVGYGRKNPNVVKSTAGKRKKRRV